MPKEEGSVKLWVEQHDDIKGNRMGSLSHSAILQDSCQYNKINFMSLK